MIYKDYFTPSPMMEDNYLEHHGVLGMKWGVRRFQNADGTLTAKGKERQDLTDKANAIRKRKDASSYFEKDNQAAAKRISDGFAKTYGKQLATAATMAVASDMIGAAMQGKPIASVLINYKNPAYLSKKVLTLAGSNLAAAAMQRNTDKATLGRFDQKGQKLTGQAAKTAARNEFKAKTGQALGQTAVKMAPYATYLAGMKMSQVVQKRRENEARFNSWGSNILPKKASDITWVATTPEGYDVYERIKR